MYVRHLPKPDPFHPFPEQPYFLFFPKLRGIFVPILPSTQYVLNALNHFGFWVKTADGMQIHSLPKRKSRTKTTRRMDCNSASQEELKKSPCSKKCLVVVGGTIRTPGTRETTFQIIDTINHSCINLRQKTWSSELLRDEPFFLFSPKVYNGLVYTLREGWNREIHRNGILNHDKHESFHPP